jgi:hypothetical protein
MFQDNYAQKEDSMNPYLSSNGYRRMFNSRIILCLVITMALLTPLVGSGTSSDNAKQTIPGILSGFADSGEFILYAKGSPIGSIFTSLDGKGNYHRKMILSMAGQTIEMTMNIIPDEKGVWKTMDISNPAMGIIRVIHEDTLARYEEKGKPVTVRLPDEYVLYDDYGVLCESFMISKYDMNAGGKQQFTRFRIPEAFPGNNISVELEYVGEDTMQQDSRPLTLRKFMSTEFDQKSVYWVDTAHRIYMIDSTAAQVYFVRKGYEYLAKFLKAE